MKKKKSDGTCINKTVSSKYAGLRKQSEASLNESSEKYINFLKNIHDGCFELDLAGDFIFFNDSVCRILGYSSDELMGMNYRQYTNEETAKKVLEEYNKVYITGQPSEGFGWQITRKDGALRYIETSVSLQKDSSGKPTGFRGIVHDITERKNAEESLKKSEEQYRLLADNITEHVWLRDLSSLKVIYISPSVEKMYGYPSDEIRNLPLKKLLTEESFQKMVDTFITEMPKALATLPPSVHKYSFETQARHKDGHLLWMENTISFIRDKTGNLTLLLGETRDITERKKAEELLKQNEEKYRLLADHMKDQVWLMDLNMNITYVSPSVERLMGYSSDEFKKLSWDKLLTPESLQKAIDFTSIRMPKAIKTSSIDSILRTLELEFIIKGGQTIWEECSFSFIRDENGKAVSILGEGRNITERKLAEEKLQQTLESLKKAVGTTIQVLVTALESKDPYTAGHQSRVANIACAIATEIELAQETIEGIRMAGIIHDIGKLAVPAEILTKPTKLTNIEFSLIKEHPQSGYEMLKDIESPWPLAQIVHQHHERMNGTGYPRKLKGEDILIESRILAVADVVEAMASHRPYRPSLGIEAALEEIEKNKGILYDETVADACLRLFREKGYQLQ